MNPPRPWTPWKFTRARPEAGTGSPPHARSGLRASRRATPWPHRTRPRRTSARQPCGLRQRADGRPAGASHRPESGSRRFPPFPPPLGNPPGFPPTHRPGDGHPRIRRGHPKGRAQGLEGKDWTVQIWSSGPRNSLQRTKKRRKVTNVSAQTPPNQSPHNHTSIGKLGS